MNETEVREFWTAHPCGDHIVGGLHGKYAQDYERFFAAYDAWRYEQEGHIPACLDRFDFVGGGCWRSDSAREPNQSS